MAMNIALKMAILNAGTTQVVVATKAEIHPSKFSNIIRGHIEPSDDEKRAIARVLRRPIQDLFGEERVAS
jgi:DNA-binding XRE family transcriptional regulator